jgi:hypothetical protein
LMLNEKNRLTSKVRLCSRSEPQSEPFVGQARWGCHDPACYGNISLIGAVASGPMRVIPQIPPLKVAIAATCSAQPAILDAFSPDFTLLQGECPPPACQVRQVGGVCCVTWPSPCLT